MSKRWRNLARPTRLAGIFLLLVWVGPVTFVQTDSWQLPRLVGAPAPAAAESRTIPAGSAVLLEPGALLRLRLRDGSTVEGRFLGRTLLDSALYARRFEAYARSSSYVPFTMGETLHVWLRDGREETAPFAGYAELTLLLLSADGPEYLRVPFEFASEIRGAGGDRVEPKALIKAFHDRSLPSAEALALGERGPAAGVVDGWTIALRVPVEDVESVSPVRPSGGGVSAGIIVLGVMFTLAIILIATADKPKPAPSSGCQEPPPFWDSGPLTRAHLTTRPFDRERGYFVGDAVAMTDPGPGQREDAPATALADADTSRALVVDHPSSGARAGEP